jgi:hypothetical protein
MTNIPIKVYGINLLVRMMAEPPADAFRDMPETTTIVAFEESAEDVEGHYFYIALEEYRVIRLDSVILSFPQQ